MDYDIVLATLNARYIHCAFGLRYLQANLGALEQRSTIIELGIKQRTLDMAEQILAVNPRIVGLGIYIWNAEPSLKLAQTLKAIRPELKLVLGGPEVSYETEEQALSQLADVVITGEADLAFAEVCQSLLAGEPVPSLVAATPPDMTAVKLPYHLYTDEDLSQRTLYVEASRGCPYTCEFCLSSLEIPVRRPELEPFLAAMQDLLDRGACLFKFVDRTFNLNLRLTTAILEFFLERYRPGLFLHFEMVPDRLPEALRHLIVRFPAGSLQFEVGIQTFNPEVAARIALHRDFAKAADNLAFLRAQTGVHVHADLIAGLPGEDLESFARGFDRLLAMGPHEIQVGILKRLRGTPIRRHTEAFQMAYSPFPPYEILCNRDLSHLDLQRLRRFAGLWDKIGNSGRFPLTLPLLLEDTSPFWSFMRFCDWLANENAAVLELGPDRLGQSLFHYLSARNPEAREQLIKAMSGDMGFLGRHLPGWLNPSTATTAQEGHAAPNTRRQERHRQALAG